MGSHTIPYTLAPHEDTHVAGGSDDIDSALAIAAAPNLTNTKIWQGDAGNRPVEVAMPAAGKSIATGSYTGDDTDDRQITTGFKCSMVFIYNSTDEAAADMWIVIPGAAATVSGANYVAYIALHATNGFVVSKTDLGNYGNEPDDVYYYWAISE